MLARKINLIGLVCSLSATLVAPAPALAEVRFKDVAHKAGLAYQQADMSPALMDKVGMLAMMSGGAAAGDFDGDGWMDLYVTRINLPNLLFRNKGDGTFEEVGAAAGVDLLSASSGCVWADIDNDGDQDLYVLTFETRNFLYINDGTGKFTEQAKARHVDLERGIAEHVSTSAAFGDVDNDGDLDLLTTGWQSRVAAREDTMTRLFINDGHGSFTDNTVNAGLTTPVVGFSPSFTDVDQDGWQDILIVGDFRSSVYYHNEGNGVFVDKTETAGVGGDENGMGSAIFDIDNDGDQDWFVSSIYDPEECEAVMNCSWRFSGNRLYLNDGQGNFKDGTDTWRVRDGGWGWGASSLDFDNDGNPDLLLANGQDFNAVNVGLQFKYDILRLWQSNGGFMTDIAIEAGVFALTPTNGVVVFDFDKDGDQDFYVVQNNRKPYLYENLSTDSGHWLRIRLQGTKSNADGVGAIIRLTTTDGKLQTRFVGNNSNYNSHNEPVVHFGLGAATGVAKLEVEWPVSGWIQKFTNLTVDQVLSIEEAEPSVTMSPDNPDRGIYWDRSRSGHGFDLQRSGDNWFLLLYTYNNDGTPLWYMAPGEINEGVFSGTATQVDYDPDRSPPQQIIIGTGGPISIDFNAVGSATADACGDGTNRDNARSLAVFDFDLDGQSGQWCVEPYKFAGGISEPDFTGSWYSSEDLGWGLTISTRGSGSEQSLVVILYYYDADQQPRWAIGSVLGEDLGSEVTLEMLQTRGYCPSCAFSEPEYMPVGNLRLTLLSPGSELEAGNKVSIEVNFSGAPGGSWLRVDEPIQLLSEPAR